MRKHGLSGKRFGCITVIRQAIKQDDQKRQRLGKHHWLVKCGCGKQKVMRGSDFTWNRTRCSNECSLQVRRTGAGSYPVETATMKTLFTTIKGGVTRKRGEGFWKLSFESFCSIIKKPCTYCLAQSSKAIRHQRYKEINSSFVFYCNGIDRVDSNKGYTKSNCVSCCKRCNSAKNDQTVGEFTEWVKKVYVVLVNGREHATT